MVIMVIKTTVINLLFYFADGNTVAPDCIGVICAKINELCVIVFL